MPDDERLREALLELQFLRQREANVLAETKALADCLEAYTRAGSPGAALASVFVSLHHKCGAAASLLVSRHPSDQWEIVAASAPSWVGHLVSAPIDLLARARNVTNLALLGTWALPFPTEEFAGLLVAPVNDTFALVGLRNRPERFDKDALTLFARLAGLAVQAHQNSLLAAEKDLLAAAISGSSSGFSIADARHPDKPLVYVNRAFETLSGYSADDVLGMNCRLLSAEPRDSPERQRLRDAVRQSAPGTFLLRNRKKTGELFWNELTLFPVTNALGEVQSLVATQTDVSARISAAEERDSARARLQSALEATDDAFVVLDADKTVAFANSAVDRLFYAPGLHWRAGTSFEANWDAYLDGCRDMPGRITRLLRDPDIFALAAGAKRREIDLPDGRCILMRARLLEDGGLVASATDVTAFKSAQDLLSQRLTAIEAATDGIAITDGGGRLTYMNSSAVRLLGFRSAAAGLGQKWQGRYETSAQFSPLQRFEATLTRAGLEAPEVHEIAGSPLDNGGAVIVVRDVTGALKSESREKDLMNDLIRLQRQEAVAQLTAGVAHDFNNLLSAINGSAALLGMSKDLSTTAQQHVQRIATAGTQAAALVNRLLDMGSSPESEGAFDLQSVITQLPGLLEPSLRPGVAFCIDIDDTSLALRGDGNMLSQVMINLIVNANDAIAQTPGRIDLIIKKCVGADALEAGVGTVRDTMKYAAMTVRDNGSGMSAEVAAQVFEPYFSTKGRSGSGLGLATAAMQVQTVGGAIHLASEPGQGTEVTLYWPLAPLMNKPEGGLEYSEQDLKGVSVIVVDDDPEVGAVVASYLEAQGAETVVCEDPRDALSAVEEDPEDWTALITDYNMPGMNGGALIEAVHAAAPNMHIFLVTALARRLSDPRITPDRVAGVFSKPINLPGLSAAVAKVHGRERTESDAHSDGG